MQHRRTHTRWARKSKGEEKIYKVLECLLPTDAFVCQATFADCLNPETGCRLRYDFGIPVTEGCWILAEYNGFAGHVVPHPFQDEAQFRASQARYGIKVRYAADRGHTLLEITAKRYSDIEEQVRQCLEEHGILDPVE